MDSLQEKNTQTSLQEITSESSNFPSTSSGIVSLKTFQQRYNEFNNEMNVLRSYGLTNHEIQIYMDLQKGQEFLEAKHKNIETSALNDLVSNINEKIEKGKSGLLDEEVNSHAKYSIDPKLQLSSKKSPKQNFIPSDHPLNHLEDVSKSLFSNLETNFDSIPSAKKQRKIIRRLERKLNEPIGLPEPKLKNNDKSSHSYEKFVKVNVITNQKTTQSNPISKWDQKTVEPNCFNKFQLLPQIEKPIILMKTVKTCQTEAESERKLYSIKDNKIVRLIKNHWSENVETSGIIIPISKAEERLLKGKKLTIDEIKQIPKFTDYSPGEPTKVLYVKNLSRSITQCDLEKLTKGKHSNIRVMSGKMRGQAFITFEHVSDAEDALQYLNGTILRSRPMIIQFGKK